ncbi:Alpha/Beta hydrolase protein [Lineolata rhizophorae]|uniref:Alpha/Beta hydrolase protein n=1 Tax=Lineolata rhizophorae TaxID=578093 RepID=A0A6A6NY68_9PEZI|nr:Alpha/Beta hydrolase protein [Lineolata rhizophorae]
MAAKPVDPLTSRDPRITHGRATLHDRNYHYLLGLPKGGDYSHTIFLIHGFPDLSMGWRCQIPMLVDMGLRVVAPDMMGYGGTDAPRVPPESMHLYGFKRAADDIAELACQLGESQIVLGGHDWGGMIVWRTAQWHPELVTHIINLTPYAGPGKDFVSLEQLAKGPLPLLGYQLQFAGPEVEGRAQTRSQIKAFLNGLFGGRGPNGEAGISAQKGILFDNLPKLGIARPWGDEMVEYYADQYARNGLHGPLNWYRTRRANYEDELQLRKHTIEVPTLFIQATCDPILRPWMSKNLERHVTNVVRAQVDATHWILIEKPDEVNKIVHQWLVKNGLGRAHSNL